MNSLTSKVTIIAGTSRGIGRGTAVALGDHGATVYVTGRTAALGEHERAGIIGKTAAEVARRGGTGIAVRVDHSEDGQVADLLDRVRSEQGRLDILVNNVFSLPEDLAEPKPFWDSPLSNREIIPSLRAERGFMIWQPIAGACHGL